MNDETLSLFEDSQEKAAPLPLPPSWLDALGSEFEKPYWAKLQEFVESERQQFPVFPPESDVYSAFQLTPLADTRVFLLGQDPYHNTGQAHGLCFSVRPGVETPPSLANMYRELRDDLGCRDSEQRLLSSLGQAGRADAERCLDGSGAHGELA